MAKVLGPIHFWQFNKIQQQEQLTQNILAAFPEEADAINAYLDENYGTLPEGDLADIIDHGNIHAWLNSYVVAVEKRLAYTISELSKDGSKKQKALDAAYAAGEADKVDADSTAKDAFQDLNDVLLDGMPCDNVNAVRSSENGVTWERVLDLRSDIYSELNANPELFDEVRDSFIRGMLSDTGLAYNRSGVVFSIS